MDLFFTMASAIIRKTKNKIATEGGFYVFEGKKCGETCS